MMTVQEMLEAKGESLTTVAPDASVLKATQLMSEMGIGSLLVTQGESLVGLVSERDVAYKLVCQGKSAADVPVSEIMTSEILCVTPRQTVEECMALMTDKRVRHLPVLDDGKLIGVISIGDAVKATISEQQFLIEQLENYISA